MKNALSRSILLLFIVARLFDPLPARAEHPSLPERPQKKGHGLTLALVGSAVVFASFAVAFELESDESYSDYLATAHPSRMESSYDRSERYRNLSTAALVAAELCMIGIVVSCLREKPEKEPEPGEVLISLKTSLTRAAVEVNW